MAHVLVEQLRFTRRQWLRGLQDVTAEEGLQRHGRINSIGWMIGHLAWHEQRYWFERASGQTPMPRLRDFGLGAPPSTPALDEVWEAWHRITAMADPWLDTLTTAQMSQYLPADAGQEENIGTRLLHINYHYWFHLGEAMAARQLLAGESQHALPEFIGSIGEVPWRPD